MKNIFIGIFLFLFLNNNSISEEIASKISDNWNQIKSMSGNFQQIDMDGNISYGNFYFLKPYQSKFEYKNKQENIITNERLLKIVDQEGYQIDSYPIGNNILKRILSNDINISKEFNDIDIELKEEMYELNLNFDNEATIGRAKFYFDKDTYDLKKWEILDEFENKTVLEFTKIKKNIFISEKLFVVKYRID